MSDHQAVAVVGLGAILPDAQDVGAFWDNILNLRYSISDVTADRWNPELYYHPDPSVPDKTYAKIGGWVRGFSFEPLKWGIPIPPRVIASMDESQQWAIAASRQALLDYGYTEKRYDPNRVAVILGNALAGESHYITALRIRLPEYTQALSAAPAFQQLPREVQAALLQGMQDNLNARIPNITEDTMPGELGNIIAGRVANVFNFGGPNFVTDAACASSLAALQAALDGLNNRQYDLVLTGGVDRSMGPEGYVKFCKIGALSPDGSRPYADGANGFVMGEGAAILLLKRLADAERDGDKIYAVIRGVGSSSDGKGKGITAPNPAGQQRAVERAWQNAGVSPATATLIEGHGTSTRVGDVVEVNSLTTVFGGFGLPVGSIALGSVKSNIGHLKSAAGAAGLLKVTLGLYHKILPPTANFTRPNPNIDFAHLPFDVVTTARPWERPAGEPRRAGVSSFGFGGTNFHLVLEEHIPGLLTDEKRVFPAVQAAAAPRESMVREPTVVQVAPADAAPVPTGPALADYGGLCFLSASTGAELRQKLVEVLEQARQGSLPPGAMPSHAALGLPERLAIEFGRADDLIKRAEKALKVFDDNNAAAWQALTAQGVYRGSGAPGKVAFLFPGQGSQYVNMLRDLVDFEPVIANTFREADEVMTPILGRSLTSYIFDDGDEEALKKAEAELRNTTITQPALLTVNVALLRLMQRFGYQPDAVLGHSLGEYAALVAAGVLTFPEALQVVSARGREMARVSMEDNGCMAAVPAPLEVVEETLKTIDGYVVIANINSPLQSVIGGNTAAVDAALAAFQAAGYQATKIPVSHAFHTRIVAPASAPLRTVIARMNIQPPRLPVIANVTGDVYPGGREEILDLLAAQVASPVQMVKSMQKLYSLGVRIFVETGPKRVASALALDNLKDKRDVTILGTNHPRKGGKTSLKEALCGLFAAGVLYQLPAGQPAAQSVPTLSGQTTASRASSEEIKAYVLHLVSEKTGYPAEMLDLDLDLEADLGIDTVKQAELFAAIRTHYNIPRREDLRLSDYNTLTKVIAFMEQALPSSAPAPVAAVAPAAPPMPHVSPASTLPVPAQAVPALADGRLPLTGSVVISGAGLGLPGRNGRVFNDENVQRILDGENFIDSLPDDARRDMLKKRVQRLNKSEAGATLEIIEDIERTVKLAGQRGEFDLTAEFGVPFERLDTLDISTQLAIGAGIEALRDAGIPLVMSYRLTSKGTSLPNRWMLPEALADETGVIFASAFPGLQRMTEEADRYYAHQNLAGQAEELRRVKALAPASQAELHAALDQRIRELEKQMVASDYHLDRRFIFRVLAMGHSQFAEYIGARGPNTHVNAACATTTHAVSVAEDWIRSGRCRRVVIIAGDDVSSGSMAAWIGSGLWATGAATTEGDPRQAILPFDRRRNGMIMGMGAAALVIESEDAARERGMRAIAEILSTQIANSAFHGTRLDVPHVSEVMERLVQMAEQRFGLQRAQIAAQTVFVSHETYTPARGGSAAAEIQALRSVFGEQASQVVIANTKGYTGHSMGVGIEDVVALKALEFGVVPPIANIRDGFEPDPDLGDLNLSRGGAYPLQYALRLGAGFGSQIAMTLIRRIPGVGERVDQPTYRRWLADAAGYDSADIEVSQRTLRIRNQGQPLRPPRRSAWQYGQGPTLWAASQDLPAPVSTPVAAPAPAAQPTSPLPSADSPLHLPSSHSSSEETKTYVLSVVSEKTGYPAEMLDLELDLEADLGIDTVKQAELFATIRTHYNIPRREDLRLSDYNTLAKVIAFMEQALQSALPVQTAAPSPAPVAAPAPAAQPSSPSRLTSHPSPSFLPSYEEIKTYILLLVSERTGYAVTMLDLELDIEAYFGLNKAGQDELLATLCAHYGVQRCGDPRLRGQVTLDKLIQFFQQALQEAAAAGQLQRQAAPATEEDEDEMEAAAGMASSTFDDIRTALQRREPGAVWRRVPRPVLRPRLELCVLTGVNLGDGTRLIVVADNGKVAESLARRLRSRKVQVLTLTAPSQAEVPAQVGAWLADGPVQGVFFLPGLDVEPGLAEMDLTAWQAEWQRRAVGLYHLMRALPAEVFLVSATRLGGLHGYTPQGASAPLGGLVSGFTKALAMERPAALVKVVDFSADVPAVTVAARLVDETLSDPGAVEIGYEGEQRLSVTLLDQEARAEVNGFAWDADSVFLVSGGAGGITIPVVLDLARTRGGKFYLLGRTPLPESHHPDLALLKSDRDSLKQELARRLAEGGNRPTPAQIDAKIAALERAAAALDLLATLKQEGIPAHYLVCDVSDAQAARQAVQKVLKAEGRVDVVLHAAGMERSRKLESKPIEEFAQTIAVKADGFFNVYKALQARKKLPRAFIFFSSVAGRFGNSGQTDYSAANDLLCKLAAGLRRQHPEVQALALDWGAWAEVGMASRGNIPRLMAYAGIDMLKPELAAPCVGRELLHNGAGGEVLLAGSLGLLMNPRHSSSGLDLERANIALTQGRPSHVMLSRLNAFDLHSGIRLEAELDPQAHPFLRDHALNGTPLLPGVIGIEGFSTAAQHIASALAGGKGGYRAARLEDINFLVPFKFYHNRPRRHAWTAFVVREEAGLVAYARLESDNPRPNGQSERLIHFTGKVFLEPADGPSRVTVAPPVWNGARTVQADDIYRLYFHGPSFQVLEAVQRSGDGLLGKLNPALPPFSAQGAGAVSVPILVELCLQTAGVWEIGATGSLVLPRAIDCLRLYDTRVNGAPVFAEVRPGKAEDGSLRFDARVVDAEGRLFLDMSGYRTVPTSQMVEEALLAPMRALVA